LFFSESLSELGGVNLLTYSIAETILWRTLAPKINAWRRKYLNLEAIQGKDDSNTPSINCYDPDLVPNPKDWPDWIHPCGFFFHETANYTPDAALLNFMNKNTKKKLVYIGFGSMVVDEPDKLIETLIEAVRRTNLRAIISKGWTERISKAKRRFSNSTISSYTPPTPSSITSAFLLSPSSPTNPALPENLSDFIYFINSIPHDWLFPRVDAIVHHGGAGTTAAAIRAGKPMIIKPFFGDQHFWGERIEKVKVGVRCSEFTPEKMATALTEVTENPEIMANAAELGEKIRHHNGPARAVEAIQKDFHFAKAVVNERHKAHSLGEGIAQLKNKQELQKQQIESLRKELKECQQNLLQAKQQQSQYEALLKNTQIHQID